MPKRYARRRPPARRRWRRNLFRRKKRRLKRREPVMPNSYLCKMKYAEWVNIDPTVGLTGQYVFSANNIYDPNVTSTGHQPNGHDQMSAFYDHYTVIGSKMKATFFAPDTVVGTSTAAVGISLQDRASVTTDRVELLENGKLSHKFLGNSQTSRSIVTCYKGFSAKKFWHVKSIVGHKDYTAGFGSSPAEQAHFHLFVSGITGTADVGDIRVLVEIEYNCVLTEKKILTGS